MVIRRISKKRWREIGAERREELERAAREELEARARMDALDIQAEENANDERYSDD